MNGEGTLALAEEKQEAKKVNQLSMDHTNGCRDLCNTVKKSAKRDKEEWIQGKCDDIQKGLHIDNHRQAYSLMKMLTKNWNPLLRLAASTQTEQEHKAR